MTIVLNGTTGIQNPLGSASAPAESNTTNSNTGAYFPTGTTYAVATAGTNALYIDASQNVGIGTTSPAVAIDVVRNTGSSSSQIAIRNLSTATNSNALLTILSNNNTVGVNLLSDGLGTVFGSVGGVLYTSTNHPLLFATNNAERMRIDTSGNVGIGTTSPPSRLSISGGSLATSGNTLNIAGNLTTGRMGTYGATSLYAIHTYFDDASVEISTGSSAGYVSGISMTSRSGSAYAGTIRFATYSAEAMRIDSNGYLYVGTSSLFPTGGSYLSMIANGGSTYGINIKNTSATVTYFMQFTNSSNGSAGFISQTGATTVSYVTASDHRLKENITPMTNGLTIIGALKPVTYDWIGVNEKGEGFVAHELQDVIPLAVTGEKDAVNEDGSIKPQGVDYSKIVVHLVAAIQELSAEVTALKAKVGA